MSGPQHHPSVGRRILDMSLTWLIVGAVVGGQWGSGPEGSSNLLLACLEA